MTTTEPDISSASFDDPLNEALLLQAVRDGSTAAFGILYARHRSFAVAVAQRALARHDPAMAEDVAEVAFIRVYTALGNGKGPSDTLRAYLATTVRREAWRAERRRRRQAEVVDQWAGEESRATGPDRSPLPSGPSDLGSHALLGEAFQGLSDRWRHVLWLTEVEGRKPSEVAPLLGLSAGSASALAYRARNGLIAAYVAAYLRCTSDETCVDNADRLAEYVAAGVPSSGYADVEAHLDGCTSCRDVARGVDVLGSVVASFAPFGVLTTGWWAASAGASSGLGAVGTAVGAAGASASARGLVGSGASGAPGGVGLGAVAAAAVSVVVLATAAWAGLVRQAPEPTASSPTATASSAPVSSPPPRATGSHPTTAFTPIASAPDATAPAGPTPTTEAARAPGPAATTPSAPAVATSPPATSTTAEVSVAAATTTAVPSTAATTTAVPSTAATTTAVATSTTTTVLPPVNGALSGRAVVADFLIPGLDLPVWGVQVVAFDRDGAVAGAAVTGFDGWWRIAGVTPGHYEVVATVSRHYRPAAGDDPWVDGETWSTTIGSIEVAGTAIDLVDLRLAWR